MGNAEKKRLREENKRLEEARQKDQLEAKYEREKLEADNKHKEEMQKLREDMLKKQMEDYQKMIDLAREENERRNKEQEERMKAILNEQARREEQLRKSFEQAKNDEEKKRIAKEKKEEEEKRDKSKRSLNKFNQVKKSIINEECEKIANKFIQDKDKFCLNEIRLYDKAEIENLVKKFENTENIKAILEEKINKFVEQFLKEKGATTIKHLNIVLVGPSGVGKSTLINSVLELDESSGAKEGEAEPCTMGAPVYYDSLKVNFIRVADSRGIEKSNDYGVDQVVKDVTEFIEGRLLTKDPDQYVHCIWYCMTGARFE